MPGWWAIFASAFASVLFGVFALVVLLCTKHLDEGKFAAAGILSITIYTLIVTLFGQWALGIEVADTVRLGFGSERFSWLMLAFLFDGCGRFYFTFIAPKPNP
jgi:hypothetical protein